MLDIVSRNNIHWYEFGPIIFLFKVWWQINCIILFFQKILSDLSLRCFTTDVTIVSNFVSNFVSNCVLFMWIVWVLYLSLSIFYLLLQEPEIWWSWLGQFWTGWRLGFLIGIVWNMFMPLLGVCLTLRNYTFMGIYCPKQIT